MKVIIGSLNHSFAGAFALMAAGEVFGQVEVTRGPYLQSGTPTSVVVRWRTDVPTSSWVWYWSDPSTITMKWDINAATEHELQLTDLSPDTRYSYAVGDVGGMLASGDDYFFVTAPDGPKPTRIWVLGDSGTANANAAAVRDAYEGFAASRHTDIWMMLGDNAYGIGTDQQYQNAVFDMYPAMLRKSVLWPTIGNHETYSFEEPMPYLSIFTLPTAGEAGGVPSGTESYYSFNYGNIHFVCLDSMTQERSSTGPMAAWLEQDLAANTNDWVIAYWHHPPYTKGSHNSDDPFGFDYELVEMRENLVPILESYGVDLVLCGHSHSYERSYLLNGHYGYSSEIASKPELILNSGSGRINESGPYVKPAATSTNQGTIYVVAGSSGQTSGGTLDHPAMFISLNQLGSLVLDIDGDRLDARFLESDGVVSDYFTILKGDEFRITSLTLEPNLLTITWRSEPGQTYYVDYKAALTDTSWTPVSGGIIAQSTQASWTGLRAPNAGTAFYRVVKLGD
jgi:hypothetical protein